MKRSVGLKQDVIEGVLTGIVGAMVAVGLFALLYYLVR